MAAMVRSTMVEKSRPRHQHTFFQQESPTSVVERLAHKEDTGANKALEELGCQ